MQEFLQTLKGAHLPPATMRTILSLTKGARKIAEGRDREARIYHYLLPSGKVVEVVRNGK